MDGWKKKTRENSKTRNGLFADVDIGLKKEGMCQKDEKKEEKKDMYGGLERESKGEI